MDTLEILLLLTFTWNYYITNMVNYHMIDVILLYQVTYLCVDDRAKMAFLQRYTCYFLLLTILTMLKRLVETEMAFSEVVKDVVWQELQCDTLVPMTMGWFWGGNVTTSCVI